MTNSCLTVPMTKGFAARSPTAILWFWGLSLQNANWVRLPEMSPSLIQNPDGGRNYQHTKVDYVVESGVIVEFETVAQLVELAAVVVMVAAIVAVSAAVAIVFVVVVVVVVVAIVKDTVVDPVEN